MDFIACWPLWCLHQRPHQSYLGRSFSCRTHLQGHMCFANEFLCSPTLSFIVHLELEWLFPGNFPPNSTVLAIRLSRILFDSVWICQTGPGFHSHLFMVHFPACCDTCRDSLSGTGLYFITVQVEAGGQEDIYARHVGSCLLLMPALRWEKQGDFWVWATVVYTASSRSAKAT